MESLAPQWDLCVVSHEIDASQIQTLANAFPYGDHVLFLPVKAPMLVASAARALVSAEAAESYLKFSQSMKRGFSTDGLDSAIARRQEALNEITDFIKQLDEVGLPRISVPLFSDKEVKLYKHLVLTRVMTEAMLSGSSQGKRQFDWDAVLSAVEKEYLNGERASQAISGNTEVMHAIGRCYGCYIDSRSPKGYKIQPPPRWSAHRAADFLVRAAHNVLLPDVSHIPLPEIAMMRDRLHDELAPMRAELLRFTDDLRKVVGDGADDDDHLMQEAENLIATRVEPVVHEAAKHAQDEMMGRLRKFARDAGSSVPGDCLSIRCRGV